MQIHSRRGLVLIELITIFAVVLLFFALQIPVIEKARENARKAQCVNNLKQMGLALHNYVSTWATFPMSNVVGKGRGNGAGCFTQILPYLENTALYNAYNFSVETWAPQNRTTNGAKVSTFLCPSNKNLDFIKGTDVRDHHDKPFQTTNTFAPLHYGANWGGVRDASGLDVKNAYPTAFPGSHLGILLTVVDPEAVRPTTNIAIRDVTDGTSFTICMIERRQSYGWGVGGWSGTEVDIYTSPFYTGDDPKLMRAFTGSYHPEYLNILMTDGAVRSVKPNQDQNVWYHMTTRAGGEVIKELP